MNRCILSVAGLALLSACSHTVRPDDATRAVTQAADASPSDGAVAVDLSIARPDAPSVVRVQLQPEDRPRSVQIGPQDVLCLSLHRRGDEMVLRIGANSPQVQPATELVLAGPGVEPGTYRTTPWQVLARLPTASDTMTHGRAMLSASTFPQCPDSAALPAAAQGRNTAPSDA